ncbi:UNVERIFIED_ORG: succinate-semialdehyde dehydrogenase/glutarate-semialdehyde dehydrogenase [Arthrobacter sp. UYEF2]
MSSETLASHITAPTQTFAVDPARVRILVAHARHSADAQLELIHTPLTGGALASLPLSTEADVAEAYTQAGDAQIEWARTSFKDRKRIMERFHDTVLDHQAEILDFIQLESGKSRGHAFEEVADVAVTARHYGRAASGYLKTRRRSGVYPVLSQARELRHPKGVVGIVSPWNYPFSLAVTDAIAALMAGNAVVLRPDRQASLSALLGVGMLRDAGLPEGVLEVVLGDRRIGQAVMDRADYACFTGSTPVGRKVAESLSGRLIGYSLELGGKNGVYVADDADLDKAVTGTIRTCFASAGQLCMSAERVIVHATVADAFTAKLIAAVEAMKVGTALEYGNDMGSLASASQLETVMAHVEDARKHGATVLTGGRHRPDLGPYVYEPTLLAGVTESMLCRNAETFGPVVAIYRVADDAEAIRLINDTEFGLHGNVFTGSVRHGRELAARIRTGTVSINDAYTVAWGSTGSPMGGMKASGVGRRHGSEGILRFTESQTVTAQHLLPFGPAFGMSDGDHSRMLTSLLRALKTAGKK